MEDYFKYVSKLKMFQNRNSNHKNMPYREYSRSTGELNLIKGRSHQSGVQTLDGHEKSDTPWILIFKIFEIAQE